MQTSTDTELSQLFTDELAIIEGLREKRGHVALIEDSRGHAHTVEIYDPNGRLLEVIGFIGHRSYNEALDCAQKISECGYTLVERDAGAEQIADYLLKILH